MNELFLSGKSAMQSGKIRKTLDKLVRYNGVGMTSADMVSLLVSKSHTIQIVQLNKGVSDMDQRVIDRAFSVLNPAYVKDTLASANLWVDNDVTRDYVSHNNYLLMATVKHIIQDNAVRYVPEYRFMLSDEPDEGTFCILNKTEYEYAVFLISEAAK